MEEVEIACQRCPGGPAARPPGFASALLPAPWLGGRCWKLFRGLLWILSRLLLPGHGASTEQPGLAGALRPAVSDAAFQPGFSVSYPEVPGNWRKETSARLKKPGAPAQDPLGFPHYAPRTHPFPGFLRLQWVTHPPSLGVPCTWDIVPASPSLPQDPAQKPQ